MTVSPPTAGTPAPGVGEAAGATGATGSDWCARAGAGVGAVAATGRAPVERPTAEATPVLRPVEGETSPPAAPAGFGPSLRRGSGAAAGAGAGAGAATGAGAGAGAAAWAAAAAMLMIRPPPSGSTVDPAGGTAVLAMPRGSEDFSAGLAAEAGGGVRPGAGTGAGAGAAAAAASSLAPHPRQNL